MAKKQKGIQWHAETWPISDIHEWDKNPRKFSKKGLADLKESLTKYGVAQPIAINTEGTIIGGHGRKKVLLEMGVETVPVWIPHRKLRAKELAELNIRFNKNIAGIFDLELLSQDFDRDDLLGWGFEDKELRWNLDRDSKLDETPKVEEKAISKPGDLFILDGKHRVLCGDATSEKDLDRLFDKKEADLLFTDPPYNVNYSGAGEKTSNTIKNDNQAEAEFRTLLEKSFNNASRIMKKNAGAYVCYASRTHREFEDSLNHAGFEVRNQIIWVKKVATMSWADYRWKHEPIFYCNRKNQSLEFYGDRKQYTVWEEERDDKWILEMAKKNITHQENGNSTVWRFNREWDYDHPTQKPVMLVNKALVNSSAKNEIIADLFLGSGSTLIASENTGRICYGTELDPKYIDVIIKRYRRTYPEAEIECSRKNINLGALK